MKALVIKQSGEAVVQSIAEPVAKGEHLLLEVRMIGLCGSDLNSFRGKNPLVSCPRIPGHEVAAAVVRGNSTFASGTDVTMRSGCYKSFAPPSKKLHLLAAWFTSGIPKNR